MATHKNFKNDLLRSNETDNAFQNLAPKYSENKFSDERRNRIIEWCTFYRRNIHLFVKHYFKINLHPYQIIMIYWMSLCDSYIAICSRAVGKTWLLAVFACAKAVLYPNSEIVVVSSTKDQAGNLIQKIEDLKNKHPNLAREISNIVTSVNKWECTFHNNSTIRVVASRDSSRGKRSTFTIYEEFRLIDKEVLDKVIRPFSYIRQTPYLENPLYAHLIEEPKEVFISSAYHKGLWWYDETRKTIKAMLNGDNSGFLALDYAVSVRHKIKTIRAIKNEISKMDEITALEEYYNIPWGESTSAYFKLSVLNRARTIKKAFYPQRMETFDPKKKNPYNLPHVDGEIRLLACDTAQRGGRANDLSITSCIRLLPTHKGYHREIVFLESYSGVDSISQALRIKQIFFDFEADAIILDVSAGGGGLPIYDQLGIVTKDAERGGIEYSPFTVMKHETIKDDEYLELSKRTLGLNAIPIIYPFSGTPELNSKMHVEMRDKYRKKLISLLTDEMTAEDYLIRNNKEYNNLDDNGAHMFFNLPFVQTSLYVNETINLIKSYGQGGNLKLEEPSGSRKDRYVAIAMGNLYATYLDQELLRENNSSNDLEDLLSVTYF